MSLDQKSRYSIVPLQGFPREQGTKLDLQAICDWLSIGFFLGNDTFYKDVKWSGLDYTKQIWRYEPREKSMAQAVEEFADVFHSIVEDQTRDHSKILLALSGGLDSRTLAVAAKYLNLDPPLCYSYRFENSFNETSYGKQIAKKLNWEFLELEIPKGYLWDKIDAAADQNLCYAEFTHPRQVAVMDSLKEQGDQFLLGHLGDLLFDDMGISEETSFDTQVDYLQKKVVKQGGLELAIDLYEAWGLGTDYQSAVRNRLSDMLSNIKIDNVNAKIRAFKSLYWVPRWTNTNLVFFTDALDVSLPYYDDRMCEFVMQTPEELLSGRRIQIEYIKKYSPDLAKIPWQDREPYNLYNYHKFKTASHLPHRVIKKLNREWKEKVRREKLVQRNWEIQFLGTDNEKQLKEWLFHNKTFLELVPESIVKKYYRKFIDENPLKYSHAISMLLTLSVFTKRNEIQV